MRARNAFSPAAVADAIDKLPTAPTYGDVLQLIQAMPVSAPTVAPSDTDTAISADNIPARKQLEFGYYLDRIVLAATNKQSSDENAMDETATVTAPSTATDLASVPTPYPLAATLLTLLTNGSIYERMDLLYNIATSSSSSASNQQNSSNAISESIVQFYALE